MHNVYLYVHKSLCCHSHTDLHMMVGSNHSARFLTLTDQLLCSCYWMCSKCSLCWHLYISVYYLYCIVLPEVLYVALIHIWRIVDAYYAVICSELLFIALRCITFCPNVESCVEFCIQLCITIFYNLHHITIVLGSCLPRPLSLLRGFVWAVSPAWKMVLGQGRFLRMEPKPEPRSDFSCNDKIYCYWTVLFYSFNTHMHTHVISQCWLIWLTDFF